MSVIGWILFGLAVGVVGKLLMPGRDPGGFILTILLGMAVPWLAVFSDNPLGFTNKESRQASSWLSQGPLSYSSFIECSLVNAPNRSVRSVFSPHNRHRSG